MPHNRSWVIVVFLIVAALQLVACSVSKDVVAQDEEPARVETIEGSEYERLILTLKAAERLDIQTEAVDESEGQLVIPYSAVLYGTSGETWVYISPEPLIYVRTPITVDVIDGDRAILTDGPSVGTDVVSIGAQMLLGVGTGVGK